MKSKIVKSALIFLFSLSVALVSGSASAYWRGYYDDGYYRGGGVRINIGPAYDDGYYRGYHHRHCRWVPAHWYRGYWVRGHNVCYRYY